MPAAMTLTAYELEREERVRINKLKLQQMGLTATLNEISSTVKAQQHVRHPFFRSPRPITAAEREAQRMAIRRSDRNAGKDAPDYRLQTSRFAIEYSPRSRVSRINRSGSYSRAVHDSSGWNPSKGLASTAAADAANDAAEALIAEIESNGGYAYAKTMTSSQVSSGFWANAPRGVEQHITSVEKMSISLRLPDSVDEPENALYQRDDGTWHCVWLPRKAGAGFSGGWRGFAIDLELFPCDVCVFEIDETKKSKSSDGNGCVDTLIVHIFRAFDYDSESVREERQQSAAAVEKKEHDEEDEEYDDEADEKEMDTEVDDDEDDSETLPVSRRAMRTARASEVAPRRLDTGSDEGTEQDFNDEEDGKEAEEFEEDAVVVVTTTKNEARIKNTKARVVIKRNRQLKLNGEDTTEEQEIENEDSEEEEEEVVKPRATTANLRKQKETTLAAPAPAATTKKAIRTYPKKQKKNHNPPAPVVEKEESEIDAASDEDDDGSGTDEEEPEYFVEKIMGVRTESDGTKRYCIKWYGYPHSQNTWEPIEMLNAPPEKYPRGPNVTL